jgi:four helix bundle protein
MAPIKRFEDIEGWQAARSLLQEFSKAVREQSTFKDKHLRDQIRDCLDSVMANIAEGFGADSDRENLRFLKIAYRSVSEFQSHLYVALDESFIDQKAFDHLYEMARETKSRIGGFMRYLKKSLKEAP